MISACPTCAAQKIREDAEILYEKGFAQLETRQKNLYFYSVMPIYREEMVYKLDHGADALLAKFAQKNRSGL